MYFTTIPFGMIAPEMYAWFYHDDGMELMQKVYEPFGLLSFPGGNTANQMGGWFRKEIKSLEDLKGLKMRTPIMPKGMVVKYMALGMVPL